MPPVIPGPTEPVTRRCDGCGATLASAPERIAQRCSYCDAHLVDATAVAVVDAVCPFAISQRAAMQRMREHVAGNPWLASELRLLARRGQLRPEVLRGVLVPYFVYDARTQSRWQARIGVDWWRRETVRDKDGKTRTEHVRETEWFELGGTAVGEWLDHLECASVALTAEEVDRLGGFDLGAAVAYDPRVLAGSVAELPSRTRAQVDRDATAAVRELEARRIEHKLLPGDHARIVALATEVTLGHARLVLAPVWLASFRHGGRSHRILVHGQHGACVGRPPLSRAKVSLAAAGFALAIVALLWLAGVWS